MTSRLEDIFNYITGNNKTGSMRARLYSNSILVAALLTIFGFITNLFINLHSYVNIFIGIALIAYSTLFIIFRISQKRYPTIFIFFSLILASAIWFCNGGISGTVNIFFILATIIFLSISNKRAHIFIILLILLNFLGLHTTQYLFPELISEYKSVNDMNLDHTITYTYVAILLYLIYKSIFNSYEDERYKVEVQKTELEIQHEYIKESINYASNIQKGFLQDKLKLSSMFNDYFVYWKPKDIVSGDFYVFNKNKKNPNQIMVAVSDCTGHGVPGAMLTMLGISFFNEIVLNADNPTPDRVLNELRTKFKTALSQGNTNSMNHDGMDMLVCLFDKERRTIEYAGSNRSLYIVSNDTLHEYHADRMPIGAHVNDHQPFSKQTIQLNKGDVAYLTTDGYADQYGEITDKKYYVSKFKRFLVSIHKKPLDEQYKILKKEFKDWKGNLEQTDDVLVVGIKI